MTAVGENNYFDSPVESKSKSDVQWVDAKSSNSLKSTRGGRRRDGNHNDDALEIESLASMIILNTRQTMSPPLIQYHTPHRNKVGNRDSNLGKNKQFTDSQEKRSTLTTDNIKKQQPCTCDGLKFGISNTITCSTVAGEVDAKGGSSSGGGGVEFCEQCGGNNSDGPKLKKRGSTEKEDLFLYDANSNSGSVVHSNNSSNDGFGKKGRRLFDRPGKRKRKHLIYSLSDDNQSNNLDQELQALHDLLTKELKGSGSSQSKNEECVIDDNNYNTDTVGGFEKKENTSTKLNFNQRSCSMKDSVESIYKINSIEEKKERAKELRKKKKIENNINLSNPPPASVDAINAPSATAANNKNVDNNSNSSNINYSMIETKRKMALLKRSSKNGSFNMKYQSSSSSFSSNSSHVPTPTQQCTSNDSGVGSCFGNIMMQASDKSAVMKIDRNVVEAANADINGNNNNNNNIPRPDSLQSSQDDSVVFDKIEQKKKLALAKREAKKRSRTSNLNNSF